MKRAIKIYVLYTILIGFFLNTSAYAQAVLETDAFDLVDGIDLVDGGGNDDSFVASDILRLGLSMSISGDTMAVSNLVRSNIDDSSLGRGRVILLRRDPAETFGWRVVSTLNHNNFTRSAGNAQEVGDEYGYEVKLDGNFLFVSSRGFDHYDYSATPPTHLRENTGVVFIYTRTNESSDTWNHFQTIYDPGSGGLLPVEGERFGHSLAHEDGTLVIGAQRSYIPGSRPNPQCGIMGEIFIYENTGPNGSFEYVVSFDWSDIASQSLSGDSGYGDPEPVNCIGISMTSPTIPNNNSGRGAGFAKSIDIEGEWIIASTEAMGDVAVFNRDHLGSWGLHSFLDPGTDRQGDWGTSISISDGRIGVGAKKYDIDGGNNGDWHGAISMFVYDSGIDEWEYTDHWTLGDVAEVDFGLITSDRGTFARTVLVEGNLLWVTTQNLSQDDDYAEIYCFSIDSAGELIPSGRVYYNGYGNGHRSQKDKLGIVVDGDVVIAGDIRYHSVSTDWNKLRLFRACVADLNNDGSLTSADGDLFVSYYTNQDDRADFAMPFGTWDINDILTFNRVYSAGCP